MVDEHRDRDFEGVGWAVAGVVHEVNGFGSGQDVECGSEDEERGARDDVDEVVLEIGPEAAEVVGRVGARGLDDDGDGYGGQAES